MTRYRFRSSAFLLVVGSKAQEQGPHVQAGSAKPLLLVVGLLEKKARPRRQGWWCRVGLLACGVGGRRPQVLQQQHHLAPQLHGGWGG